MWQCIECDHENPKTLDSCENCSTTRPPSSLIGEQISQWVIEKELGEGGMAIVFQARHVMLGSPVAIKILRADLLHKREVVERFRTEALAASHLRHDNVIQVHDFGSQKGIGVYMVLEFLAGMDLEVKLEESEPMPLAWTMNIAKQICSGLEAAHNAGIIHRDLKPSNIYLVPRQDHDMPQAKILDFGIAKIQESQLFEGPQNLTRTGTVLGTPYYLSPEQLRRRDKQELGPSVDIYAFGVILYQMLTGQLPIEEPTLAEQMAAILTRKPPLLGELRPDLAGTSLELLLHRLLAKKPDERPATIGEVWQELEKAAGALNDPSIDAALRQQWTETYKTPDLDGYTPTTTAPPRTFFAQYGVTLALMLLVLVGGAALAFVIFNKNTQKPPNTRRIIAKQIDLPGWVDLRNQGARAYKSGNYLEAIRLWRKSLAGLKQSAKSGKGTAQLTKQSRVLLQSLGIAAQKSNRNYAALHFYQQLTKTPGLSPKESSELASRIRGLREELSNNQKAIKLIDEIVSNNLRGKNYKEAQANLEKLTKYPDRSLPLPLEKAADRLQELVPGIALKHYTKALLLSLDQSDRERIRKKRDALQKRIKDNRKALAALLASPSKFNKKTRRAIDSLLQQQPGDLLMHQRIMARIRSLLTTDPNLAIELLRTYRKSLKGLQRKPAWVWLQPLSGSSIPNDAQLKHWLTVARKEKSLLRQLLRQQRTAARYLERSQMARWLTTKQERLATLQKLWSQLDQTDGPLKTQASNQLKRTQAQSKQFAQISQNWQQIKDKHEEDRLALADDTFQSLTTQLKQQPQLVSGFNKAHNEWKEQHLRAAQHLKKGDESAQRSRWTSCKRRFDLYLRLYPKAHNKDAIKLKRCKCRCKLPAPFEPCSEQCKLPYN